MNKDRMKELAGANVIKESRDEDVILKEWFKKTVLTEETDYEAFFKKALKKFDVNAPDELDDEKKKEFFDYVDANWDAGENETDIDESNNRYQDDVESAQKLIDKALQNEIELNESLNEGAYDKDFKYVTKELKDAREILHSAFDTIEELTDKTQIDIRGLFNAETKLLGALTTIESFVKKLEKKLK